ncbi:hypothetical protein B0H15DRAFT_60837 [Mycena belliarum]|uniref:Uncharacterized protein n=1 Tax=Mycena belliarum TaxID=1033014 RepID=A0AAD6TQQ9_9AGAR|nr:hypothetical protein B0H15DRAFT_60837 [Mycena belliae]
MRRLRGSAHGARRGRVRLGQSACGVPPLPWRRRWPRRPRHHRRWARLSMCTRSSCIRGRQWRSRRGRRGWCSRRRRDSDWGTPQRRCTLPRRLSSSRHSQCRRSTARARSRRRQRRCTRLRPRGSSSISSLMPVRVGRRHRRRSSSSSNRRRRGWRAGSTSRTTRSSRQARTRGTTCSRSRSCRPSSPRRRRRRRRRRRTPGARGPRIRRRRRSRRIMCRPKHSMHGKRKKKEKRRRKKRRGARRRRARRRRRKRRKRATGGSPCRARVRFFAGPFLYLYFADILLWLVWVSRVILVPIPVPIQLYPFLLLSSALPFLASILYSPSHRTVPTLHRTPISVPSFLR